MSDVEPPETPPAEPVAVAPTSLVSRLYKLPAHDFSAEVAKIDPVTWAMKYRFLRRRRFGFRISEEEKKKPFLWRFHRPFNEKYLADIRKCKVTEKSRQCGISETALTEEVWFCDTRDDVKCIHTFPRDKQVQRFSGTRVDPFLNETEYLKSRVGSPSQIGMKKIGGSFLMFESSWNEELGENVDADMVTFDEKDRMKPRVEFAFEESLSSSEWGLTRYISTPSLPMRGVDEYFQRSDQQIWMMKCDNCGAWQTLAYPDNFHQIKDYPIDAMIIPHDSWEFICRRCKLPRINRWDGFWYSTKPENKDIAGYHISQAMCVWISATEIMQKRIKYRYPNIWFNYVLGLAYRSDTDLVGEDDFRACYTHAPGWTLKAQRPKGIVRVAAGIDWGDISWCVVWGWDVNRKLYLLDIMVVPKVHGEVLADAVEINRRLKMFDPDIVVADAGYGKDANAMLLRLYPGRFYANYFPRTPVGSKLFNPVWDEASAKSSCDKTLILKQICHQFKYHDKVIIPDPDGCDAMKSFVGHFGNLTLTLDDDDDGAERGYSSEYEKIESVGADHLALAAAYGFMGLERYMVFGGGFTFDFV
jgi:hypothetical protein